MWNPAQNLQFISAFMVTRKDPLSWCFSCIIFSLSYIRDAGGIPNPNTKPPAGTTGLSSFFAMPMLSIFLSLFLIERERERDIYRPLYIVQTQITMLFMPSCSCWSKTMIYPCNDIHVRRNELCMIHTI